MDNSFPHSDKSTGLAVVADPEAHCESIFVCKCEPKNGVPDTQGSDDNKTSKMDLLTCANKPHQWSSIDSTLLNYIGNSNVQNYISDKIIKSTKIPFGSSNGRLIEPDLDVLCAQTLKGDRVNGHKSCKWGLYADVSNTDDIKVSNDLDSYVFASHLFDYCSSKRNVKNKHKELNFHMKYYDQVLEIYSKLCSTEKELDVDDFNKFTEILTSFKKEGLMTDNTFLNFKKEIRESGYLISEIDGLSSNISAMNMEESHQTSNAPKFFNTVANKLFSKDHQKLVGDMKDIKYKHPDIIFAKLMEPIEKYDNIKSRLNILNSLDFLVVMSDIEFFYNEKLLCHCDLSKFTEVDKLVCDLLTKKVGVTKQMKNPQKKIFDGLQYMPNGEIEYDLEKREWPMEDVNWELLGQKVCITGLSVSGHNTPFCEMCGLQSSWLKTFKKRGIQIKKADSFNTKYIWKNNTKDK